MHNAEFTKVGVGLAALIRHLLTNVLRQSMAPEAVHSAFFFLGALVLCVFTVLYVIKMAFHPDIVAREWACLVRCNFSECAHTPSHAVT